MEVVKGLIVIPDIELIEKSELMKADSEKVSALQYFCIGWSVLVPGIIAAIETIKWPWWKWAAQIGVSVINQIHGKICPTTPPQA